MPKAHFSAFEPVEADFKWRLGAKKTNPISFAPEMGIAR